MPMRLCEKLGGNGNKVRHTNARTVRSDRSNQFEGTGELGALLW